MNLIQMLDILTSVVFILIGLFALVWGIGEWRNRL